MLGRRLTTGVNDVLAGIERPDDETMAPFPLAVGRQVAVETGTMPAVPEAELRERVGDPSER